MLQNAYFLAKIGADTAENEQHFAEILPKIGNYPTGPLGPGHRSKVTRTAALGPGIPGRKLACGPLRTARRGSRGEVTSLFCHR